MQIKTGLTAEAENCPLKLMAKDPPVAAGADVVEAMASHRPYRAALGIEVALKEIERSRGTALRPCSGRRLPEAVPREGLLFSGDMIFFSARCDPAHVNTFRRSSREPGDKS